MQSFNGYLIWLYLSHIWPGMLLPFWKVRHSLRLNVRKPQVCGVYTLLRPHIICQDVPTQCYKETHRLLLPPYNGLKEWPHLKGVGNIDEVIQIRILIQLFIGGQYFLLLQLPASIWLYSSCSEPRSNWTPISLEKCQCYCDMIQSNPHWLPGINTRCSPLASVNRYPPQTSPISRRWNATGSRKRPPYKITPSLTRLLSKHSTTLSKTSLCVERWLTHSALLCQDFPRNIPSAH